MQSSRLSEGQSKWKKPSKLSIFLLFRLFVSIGKAKWFLFLAGIFLIITVAVDIQVVRELGRILDRPDLQEAPLWQIIGLLTLFSILTRICGFTQFSIAVLATNRSVEAFRKDFFQKLLQLSKRFYDESKVGWLVARAAGDMGTILEFFSIGMTLLMLVVVFMIMSLYQISQIAPILLLPIVIFLPFALGTSIWFRFQMSKNQRLLAEANSHMIGYIAENIRGIRVTQAFAREAVNTHHFEKHNLKNMELGVVASKLSGAFVPTVEFIGLLGIIGVMAFGTWLIQDHYEVSPGVALTTGELATCLLYLNMMLIPIRMVVDIYSRAIAAMAAAERIFEILDLEPDVQDAPNCIPLPQLVGNVEFHNMSFAYNPQNPPVFQNLNLQIAPHETIALVGKTGAGKSTLAYLIARFYDVTEGCITIDGIDIRTLVQRDLHQFMGIVLQEGFLFSGTILDNIRFCKSELSETEVIQFTKKLGTHDAIMRIPGNYSHRVGEAGYALSHGQRQMISFSRALTANPKLLILDEATSSIDTYTESILTRALERLTKNRTTIIIAHRLSTIKRADRILVIGEGGVLEQGNFAQLMSRQGHFASLYSTYQQLERAS